MENNNDRVKIRKLFYWIGIVFIFLLLLNSTCTNRTNKKTIHKLEKSLDDVNNENDSLKIVVEDLSFLIVSERNRIIVKVDSFITEMDRNEQAREIQKFVRGL